jgi:death on curing protein
MTTHLALDDLLELTHRLGAGPVRDAGLLDSAASRSRTTVFGTDAYPTIELKAAALLHSIACNHALVDGNKRLALLAATVFLGLNGYDLDLTDDEAFDLTVDVAAGQARDVDEIASRLRLTPRG